MALPLKLIDRLDAAAAVVVSELMAEGKAGANDPEKWPYALIDETLDEAACALCRTLDGKVLRVETPEYAQWRGPSHINCRRVLVYLHQDDPVEKTWFRVPDAELVRKHGHFHVDPGKHAELRIPAEPAGRHVTVRRVKDPESGEIRTRLDWAPWWEGLPQRTKDLVLEARVAPDSELPRLLEKLGITDPNNIEHLREATLLGLRDRMEGWLPLVREEKPGEEGAAKREATRTDKARATRPRGETEPVYGPIGTPVSMALEVDMPGFEERAKRVLAAVDATHGGSLLRMIPVRLLPPGAKAKGLYEWTPDDERITVDPGRAHPEFTFAHEIGHFIDNIKPEEGGYRSSGPQYDADYNEIGDELGEWRTAVQASAAWQALDRMEKELHRQPVPLLYPNGEVLLVPVRANHIREFVSVKEAWARCYAQYVATRSGDPVLLEQLNLIRSGRVAGVYPAMQWSDEDFAPIAAVMDKVFEGRKWRAPIQRKRSRKSSSKSTPPT